MTKEISIKKVEVKIKLKSFPVFFSDIVNNLRKSSNYVSTNFTRIGTGSEAEIFKLPSGNVLRVSQDPCSKDLHKFFMSHKNICYPQVFNFEAVRNKFNQDIYVSEMENLIKLSKEEKDQLKPIETYFKTVWSNKNKTVKVPELDRKLQDIFKACDIIFNNFKDTKYRNDMFTRNFMKRPNTNTFVVVDPICLKSFIRI